MGVREESAKSMGKERVAWEQDSRETAADKRNFKPKNKKINLIGTLNFVDI